MAPRIPAQGWHDDPDHLGSLRYWDGKRWNGTATVGPGGIRAASYSLTGWRRLWYRGVVGHPVVFHVLAWFNCSVPGTKGRLDRLMQPAQAQRLSSPAR
jgi:hypothetical protein